MSKKNYYSYKKLITLKNLIIISLFVLICSFFLKLPVIFYIIGEIGLIGAFILYGWDGLRYYKNTNRFYIWILIPGLTIISYFFVSRPFFIFGIDLAKIIFVFVIACAILSIYYNRYKIEHALIVTLLIIGVIVISAILSMTLFSILPYFGTQSSSKNNFEIQTPINFLPFGDNLVISNVVFEIPPQTTIAWVPKFSTTTRPSTNLAYVKGTVQNNGASTYNSMYLINARIYDKNGNFVGRGSKLGFPLEPKQISHFEIQLLGDYTNIEIGKIEVFIEKI